MEIVPHVEAHRLAVGTGLHAVERSVDEKLGGRHLQDGLKRPPTTFTLNVEHASDTCRNERWEQLSGWAGGAGWERKLPPALA